MITPSELREMFEWNDNQEKEKALEQVKQPPKVVAYLDCGCAISNDGHRSICPSCQVE